MRNVIYIMVIVVSILLFMKILITKIRGNLLYKWKSNDNNSLRIIDNAFPDEIFHKIRNYLDVHTDIRTYPSESNQIADRSSMKLEYSQFNFIYDALESNTFGIRNARVSRVVPVEYRIYKSGSFGMKWHKDIRVLPENKHYYEVIFVIYNNSDNMLEYVVNEPSINIMNNSVSVPTNTKPTRSVFTAANTVVLIHPESVLHRSTPLHYGEKIFIKYVLEYG